jgi:Sensors of blue-light using FAD
MTDLSCILYVSSAIRMLSEPEIDPLFERARSRNLEEGVTGILLHFNGNFMQYLEGPLVGLERIYRIIQESSLHSGIEEIIHEPIQRQAFPKWSMAYRRKDFEAFTDPDNYAELLSARIYRARSQRLANIDAAE